MRRRAFLAATAGLGLALAGCEEQEVGGGEPPLVENRPDAVYVPSHVEGMQMIDMAMSGRLQLALSYSYPHRFWLVNGDRTNTVEIGTDDSAHLMISAWDSETGAPIPSSNASVTVTRDGDSVVEKSMWPMLSQNMGFHYGDNVALGGDGTYQVEVRFGPVGTRRTGGLRAEFAEQVTSEITFEFSRAERDEIMFRPLSERQGERAAVDPMQMDMLSVHQLPRPGSLPGTALGEGTSGDGVFVARALEDRPDGVEGSGPYLAVSARTPYNRYPLPFLALSAELVRDGETVFDGSLRQTLDPDVDFHYGAGLERLPSAGTLTLTPETPPQVARHEGYETAFLDMRPVTLDLDGR